MVFMVGVLSVVSEGAVGASHGILGMFRMQDVNLVGKFVELRSGRGGLKLCHITLSLLGERPHSSDLQQTVANLPRMGSSMLVRCALDGMWTINSKSWFES